MLPFALVDPPVYPSFCAAPLMVFQGDEGSEAVRMVQMCGRLSGLIRGLRNIRMRTR